MFRKIKLTQDEMVFSWKCFEDMITFGEVQDDTLSSVCHVIGPGEKSRIKHYFKEYDNECKLF